MASLYEILGLLAAGAKDREAREGTILLAPRGRFRLLRPLRDRLPSFEVVRTAGAASLDDEAVAAMAGELIVVAGLAFFLPPMTPQQLAAPQ